MPYLNLKAEMAKKGITIEAIAKTLGLHRNSVAYKLNKGGSFSIEESMKIHKVYFTGVPIDYLFERDYKHTFE